jgi:hypothetical protein
MALSASILPGGCPQPPPAFLLADQVLDIPGAGGYAAISFRGAAGQTIRVTLVSAESCLSPYASLRNPDGSSGGYVPALDTALCGGNTGQTTLALTGTYSLSVFSGANAGGRVAVTIEAVPE